MKNKILIVLLSAFLVSTMVVPALAQDMTLGVSVDDWFKYKRSITRWESTEPFLWEGYMGPLTLADNETNFVLYTVTDITPVDGGNNVTFAITYDWINGSVTESSLVVTVTTANTNLQLIGADLEPGDMISDTYDFFGSPYPARTINSTIDREYVSGTRETNVLDYVWTFWGTPYSYIYQWDKATGIQVYYEASGDVAGFGTPYNYTVTAELLETNVTDWTVIPEFTGVIMLSLLIAITIPIVIHKRKTLKY